MVRRVDILCVCCGKPRWRGWYLCYGCIQATLQLAKLGATAIKIKAAGGKNG